ncbi:hypothetical protein AB1N83_008031 [Pleurotus pulmonarius]
MYDSRPSEVASEGEYALNDAFGYMDGAEPRRANYRPCPAESRRRHMISGPAFTPSTYSKVCLYHIGLSVDTSAPLNDGAVEIHRDNTLRSWSPWPPLQRNFVTGSSHDAFLSILLDDAH